MSENKENNRLIKTAKALFFILAIVWFIFGITAAIETAKLPGASFQILIIVALIYIANAVLMFVAGWGLGKAAIFYFFGVLLLVMNIFLSATDEFGLADLLTMMLDLVLFIILVVKRRDFIGEREA